MRQVIAMYWLLSVLIPGTAGAQESLDLVVLAGEHDRRDSVVRRDWPLEAAPPLIRSAIEGSHGLVLTEPGSDGAQTVVEARAVGEGPAAIARLTFLLPGDLNAGESKRFTLSPCQTPSPWGIDPEGAVKITLGGRPVLTYNTQLVSDPSQTNPNQPRNAYIHPAFSPSGAIVTGDYSANTHPHHRGIFLAYAKAEAGDLHPDFWNIQGGSGRIRFEAIDAASAGAVSARFSTRHRWEALAAGADPRTVLEEEWEVEVFAPEGTPYFLVELTSTQTARGGALTLPPYRYGGLAYRGPESFLPAGAEIVLTSEGLDRVAGDQQPARWVDLTGPLLEGGTEYGGAAILDHPANLNHPTPARIHPSRIPFFCFTPAHDRAVVLEEGRPVVFRYRVVLHDGKPDGDLNDRLWNDFSAPALVETPPAG